MRKMNHLIPLLFFLLWGLGGFAQEKLSKQEKERREKNIKAGNPFVKYGCKAPVATLSKGKYLEVQDLDSIVTIGTMRWHVDKNQIVGRIVLDTLNIDAQPIGDAPGMWMSPDPLSEEFPSYSPYSFCFGNPIRLVDKDGRAPSDIIIKGTEAQKALSELQKSVGNGITLSMDVAGKVTYISNPQGTLSTNASEVTKIIDDHSITVNVTAENSYGTSTNNLYVGGAFMGNMVTNSNSGNTVVANQEVNPIVLENFSNANNKPGEGTLHEVTEANQGALLSQTSGVSSPNSSQANSVYSQAHANAIPQPGIITARYYNPAGLVVPPKPLSGEAPEGPGKTDYISNGKRILTTPTIH